MADAEIGIFGGSGFYSFLDDKTSNGHQLKVTDANLDAAKKFLDAVAKVAPPAKATATATASNVTRMPNEMEKLERKVAARPRAGSREPRATFSA